MRKPLKVFNGFKKVSHTLQYSVLADDLPFQMNELWLMSQLWA